MNRGSRKASLHPAQPLKRAEYFSNKPTSKRIKYFPGKNSKFKVHNWTAENKPAFCQRFRYFDECKECLSR